jgi:hypothetical protein
MARQRVDRPGQEGIGVDDDERSTDPLFAEAAEPTDLHASLFRPTPERENDEEIEMREFISAGLFRETARPDRRVDPHRSPTLALQAALPNAPPVRGCREPSQ